MIIRCAPCLGYDDFFEADTFVEGTAMCSVHAKLAVKQLKMIKSGGRR